MASDSDSLEGKDFKRVSSDEEDEPTYGFPDLIQDGSFNIPELLRYLMPQYVMAKTYAEGFKAACTMLEFTRYKTGIKTPHLPKWSEAAQAWFDERFDEDDIELTDTRVSFETGNIENNRRLRYDEKLRAALGDMVKVLHEKEILSDEQADNANPFVRDGEDERGGRVL